MKRAFFILIIFAFTILGYEEVGARRWTKRWVNVTGTVINIKEQAPFLAIGRPSAGEMSQFSGKVLDMLLDFWTARGTITLRTEKGDITLPVNHRVWDSEIKIDDIVSVRYVDYYVTTEGTWPLQIVVGMERIRTRTAEKIRIASAQLPEAIAYAKLGKTKEAIDIYLDIPEEVLTPNNIPLWNDRNALLQTLKPYVQTRKDNAKSLELKGQYKEALNEYAEALKVADDNEAKEIRKAALEIIRRNPSLSELPEEARRHVLRGEVLVKEGNFEQAVEEYKKAIHTAPFVAKLYFNTAMIYGELKNYPGAIRHMKIYLQSAPDAPDARAAQDEIYKWELMMEKEKK